MERNELDENEQAEFERKLRFALQHREAPLGLKQRVLAQSRQRARERRQAQGGRFWMFQRVAASAVLAVVFGGFAVYQQVERRAERRKGEEAREQVILALRITHRTLDRVGERLADNGR